MKKLSLVGMLLLTTLLTMQTACKKDEPMPVSSSAANTMSVARGTHANRFDASVAAAWMKMQIRIMSSTAGIPNVAFTRPLAYSGITLYEAVLPGMPSYQSMAGQLNGLPAMPATTDNLEYYWPSSANAALASINRRMFPTTSVANMAAIDSLENALNTSYSTLATSDAIARSVDFGRAVAQIVYDWAQTDGYNHASDAYTAPLGVGLWVPTPAGFAAASTPYWGNVRVMVSGSDANAQPSAPTPYSEAPGSAFYNMAQSVYDASQTLTPAQSAMGLFWRDLPGVSTPGHYLSILEQVIELQQPTLEKAAVAYAKCGIVVFDAAVSCWKTKYTFNLVRPVTYIRNVLGHTTWLPLLSTPAHPEFSSAHAVLSAANAEALTSLFGDNFSFTDHTHDYLGIAPRTFSSFRACGVDAGNSRLYAGIHYQPSIDIGLIQGRTIYQNISNALVFQKL